MYLIGYDIGSSSIKAALLNAKTNKAICKVSYPEKEMRISAPQKGWAEQDPQDWWTYVQECTESLLSKSKVDPKDIVAIGVSYQMHGLVLVDHHHEVIRPAIIWCDGRAIAQGERSTKIIGEEICLEHHLNTLGNFTASKLAWVKENEPDNYKRINAFILPGDFIVMKMVEKATSTISGYSEGILWDYKNHLTSDLVLDAMDINPSILAPLKKNFGLQGKLAEAPAKLLGLHPGTPITYRGGDQPNNALSLGVVHPGQVAATGGTSGVVYGVLDNLNFDPKQRVNSFVHVNHEKDAPRIGVLLCINGAGIAYGWMKNQISGGMTFDEMGREVDKIPIGSDGLVILPFGNGAERMLGNRQIDSSIFNLDWNRHTNAHLFRATLEGIAFAYVYGMSILKELGIDVSSIRVGNDNLFQSASFGNTIATLMDSNIHVIETNGAIGAARGAGIGLGHFELDQAFETLEEVRLYEPQPDSFTAYSKAYELWLEKLNQQLDN